MGHWEELSNVELQIEWATFLHSVNGFDKIYYDTLNVLTRFKANRYLPVGINPNEKFYTHDYLKKLLSISGQVDGQVSVGSAILLFLYTWHSQGISSKIEPELSSVIRSLSNQLQEFEGISPAHLYKDDSKENLIKTCYEKLDRPRIQILAKNGSTRERGLGPKVIG